MPVLNTIYGSQESLSIDLSGTYTMRDTDPGILLLNPNGADRDVILAPRADNGKVFTIINNSDGTNVLNIREEEGGAIALSLDDTTVSITVTYVQKPTEYDKVLF